MHNEPRNTVLLDDDTYFEISVLDEVGYVWEWQDSRGKEAHGCLISALDEIVRLRELLVLREAELAAATQEIERLRAPSAVCGVVGYPEAGRHVCELPAGHKDYHQQGHVRWLGYHHPPNVLREDVLP